MTTTAGLDPEVALPSRRRFLIGAGSAFGATWTRAGPPSSSDDRPPVVVVGAGLAGLAAALELAERGVPVRVLEARSEPGGRVRTARAPFRDGFNVELGPWRIPASHSLTLGFARKFGLKPRPVRSDQENRNYYVRGRALRGSDVRSRPELLPYELPEEERRLGPIGLWERSLEPYMRLRLPPTVNPWPRELSDLDHLSLGEFLKSRQVSTEGLRMIGDMLGFAPFLHTAFLANFREELHDYHDGFFTIDGGNDRLPKLMAGRLKDAVQYGIEVVRVEHGGPRPVVCFIRDGRRERLVAERVVLAVPFSVLRDVVFEPALSPEKARAVRELNYEPATKVVLQCRRRFWEGEGGRRGGVTYTDLPIQSILYQDWSDRADGRGLMVFYAMGRAGPLDQVGTTPELIRTAIGIGEKIHPGLGSEVEEAVAIRWGREPFARGAYPVFLPGQESEMGSLLARREGRLHFAGDHASVFPGWMNGALESGQRVAHEISALT
ncbi:flavin monoamine oxidase family protein [Paludisphaera mucosa]|uniref:Tryptophan 2-monooxygenase n=1 Tax=Paludisphaera mucosa TaxID=3030827 RepID=A0ABT6FLB3_9BACT|nr:NAD(P)/FAD-dependent oxidoreductase [Paludisphaera mucosa]MDG3008359.1 NAD(P)/FAD-dependent oxidoreductase [Paludisphaera mucosa]